MRAFVNFVEKLLCDLVKVHVPLVLQLEHLACLKEGVHIYTTITSLALEKVLYQGTLEEASFLDVLYRFISHDWLEVQWPLKARHRICSCLIW